jgi:TP901-1 family phage major tail protein
MTAQQGDDVILKIGNGATPTETFTAVGGLRLTSCKLNNMVRDASTFASGKWRKLLSAAGISSLAISGNGYFTDTATEETLRSYAFAASLNNYELTFGNGHKIAGAFLIAEYSRSGDLRQQEEFTIRLESGGAVVYS